MSKQIQLISSQGNTITALIDDKLQKRTTKLLTVESYQVSMMDQVEFPPLTLIELKHKFYVVDGFHRGYAYLAATQSVKDHNKAEVKLKEEDINYQVHTWSLPKTLTASKVIKVDSWEEANQIARDICASSNQKNGERLSSDDCKAIAIAEYKKYLSSNLKDKEVNEKIAKYLSVKPRTIQGYLKELRGKRDTILKDKVKALSAKGYSHQRIFEDTGVPKATIGKWLRLQLHSSADVVKKEENKIEPQTSKQHSPSIPEDKLAVSDTCRKLQTEPTPSIPENLGLPTSSLKESTEKKVTYENKQQELNLPSGSKEESTGKPPVATDAMHITLVNPFNDRVSDEQLRAEQEVKELQRQLRQANMKADLAVNQLNDAYQEIDRLSSEPMDTLPTPSSITPVSYEAYQEQHGSIMEPEESEFILSTGENISSMTKEQRLAIENRIPCFEDPYTDEDDEKLKAFKNTIH